MYIRNDDEESHILATTWTLGSLRLQDKSDIAYRTIQFRLCALTYRSLRGSTPPYLAEALHFTSDVESRCRLRSGYTSTLVILSSRRTTLGDRAFPCGCSTSLELPDGYLSERRRQTRSFDATWSRCRCCSSSRRLFETTGHNVLIHSFIHSFIHSWFSHIRLMYWHNATADRQRDKKEDRIIYICSC